MENLVAADVDFEESWAFDPLLAWRLRHQVESASPGNAREYIQSEIECLLGDYAVNRQEAGGCGCHLVRLIHLQILHEAIFGIGHVEILL